MSNPMFSIIVVSLNSGERMNKTIKSIESQTFKDYEVIVQDGMSVDDSIPSLYKYLEENREFSKRVKVYKEKDKGIYDGMNSALKKISGDFVIFMNCGDCFYDDETLEKIAKIAVNRDRNTLFYGDVFNEDQNSFVHANPSIDDFACFRHMPNHQACIYSSDLFSLRAYDIKYRVRADYEHLLYCYYRLKTKMVYIKETVALYEGGGYSDKHKKMSADEHKEICLMYIDRAKLFKFRAIMLLSLQPLRTMLSESKTFSRSYNRLKSFIYKNRE